jgi:hypothetical protein
MTPRLFSDRDAVNDIRNHEQIWCFFGVDRNIARRHADAGPDNAIAFCRGNI